MNIFGREPVLWMAVITTAISLGAVLWPDRLSPEIQAAIIALAGAIIALIARSSVTPVTAPQLEKGTTVTVTDVKGTATEAVKL